MHRFPLPVHMPCLYAISGGDIAMPQSDILHGKFRQTAKKHPVTGVSRGEIGNINPVDLGVEAVPGAFSSGETRFAGKIFR